MRRPAELHKSLYRDLTCVCVCVCVQKEGER